MICTTINSLSNMSKAISELSALCDVLSFMRTPTAFDSARQMYKHFCKPETGTIRVWYYRSPAGPYVNKILYVRFIYATWLGAVSKLSIDTTKYY